MTYSYKYTPVLDKAFDRDDALRDLSARIAMAQARHDARFIL
jgi:hypothetical protein